MQRSALTLRNFLDALDTESDRIISREVAPKPACPGQGLEFQQDASVIIRAMSNPFPGANPYLEQPDYWSDFHNQLVAEIARALIPKVLPNYRVVIAMG